VKNKDDFSQIGQIALYIHSSMYSLLGAVSLFGFVGAIIRGRTMISIFLTVLVGHLILSIFSGAFALYNIWNVQGSQAVQDCIKGNADTPGQSQETCQASYDVVKGLSVAIFILIWLLEIWGCFIVNDYIGQLEDEEYARYPKVSDIEASQVYGPRPL